MTAAAVTIAIAAAAPAAQAKEYSRISNTPDGAAPNGASFAPATSHDGRVTAYISRATDLVAGDDNGRCDVFVHDAATGTTERIGRSTGMGYGPPCGEVSISGDGRLVAFDSDDPGLVEGDTNDREDVFVHDRATGVTRRVSVASDGTQGRYGGGRPDISEDGRVVAFLSGSPELMPAEEAGEPARTQVVVHDLVTGLTERVVKDGSPLNVSVSAGGRHVAVVSAHDHVPGDSNGGYDVYVLDRQTGEYDRVSVSSEGDEGHHRGWCCSAEGVDISADGRFVAFDTLIPLAPEDTDPGSLHNDTADVYRHDRQTGETRLLSEGETAGHNPSISSDGSHVVFDATLTHPEIQVHDAAAGTTADITRSQYDGSRIPAISGDGRVVTFGSTDHLLVPLPDANWTFDVFSTSVEPLPPRDLTAPQITVPEGIETPGTSGDGAVVTFEATATDDRDGAVPVSCYPGSGELFPYGTTEVWCYANDQAGNFASASFVVQVRYKDELVAMLAQRVFEQPDVVEGYRRQMLARLDAAFTAISESREPAACRELRVFVRLAEQSEGAGVPTEVGDGWAAEARRILGLLTC